MHRSRHILMAFLASATFICAPLMSRAYVKTFSVSPTSGDAPLTTVWTTTVTFSASGSGVTYLERYYINNDTSARTTVYVSANDPNWTDTYYTGMLPSTYKMSSWGPRTSGVTITPLDQRQPGRGRN